MRARMYCWRLASAAIASLFLVTVTMAQIAFPELTGRVVDGANLLSDTKEEEIVDMLRQHEDTGGDQVVVATVQSLQGRTIEEFAVELARYWGIGQEGRNNGVLLLVAPNERQVRIEVGYGLEGFLTDARAATIIANEIVPPFRAGDRAKGIVQGVQGILAALEKRPDTVSGVAPEKQKFALPPVIIFFIFIMIILSLRSFGRASRRHNMRGHRDWHTGGRMSGGSFSGGRSGGFSGGGGSFGGGGSSGSW